MSSVSARRAKAIALIKAGLIHSQSDLVKQLKKAGFESSITAGQYSVGNAFKILVLVK